ncbi:MAG: hypothetical protein QF570_11575 [Myxococcota bacterium]|nr:hypothetical protein [Myxococcota bacterium]
MWAASLSGTLSCPAHHYWGSELYFVPRDGHPRHVDPLWPLWNVLDLTPEGRGDFFPSLEY